MIEEIKNGKTIFIYLQLAQLIILTKNRSKKWYLKPCLYLRLMFHRHNYESVYYTEGGKVGRCQSHKVCDVCGKIKKIQ